MNKKRLSFLLLPTLLLSSCELAGFYHLDSKALEDYLYSSLPTHCREGEAVIVKTFPLNDASLEIFANGDSIGTGIGREEDNGDYVWTYSFVMPDEDVVLTYEISDGFLPNPDDPERYEVHIEDESFPLFGDFDPFYEYGEEVEIRTHILMDASMELFVDGESIGTGEFVSENGLSYWLYTFVMPDHDVTLSYAVQSGMTVSDCFDFFDEEIVGIRILDFENGYEQNTIASVTETDTPEEISAFLADFSRLAVSKTDSMNGKGRFSLLEFEKANGEVEKIEIFNSYIQTPNDGLLFLQDAYFQPDWKTCYYQFYGEGESKEDLYIDGEYVQSYVDKVPGIAFVFDNVDFSESGYVLKTGFGDICFYSENTFRLEGEWLNGGSFRALDRHSFDFIFDSYPM